MSDAIAELEGLRALARALAHGDADDLLQDAALAALEHPPDGDRPVKPWLATVILNRWRMNRRGDTRRRAREVAIEIAEPAEPELATIDRARMLQRLSDALVSLAEPFRQTVIARYLDDKSCAQIAREAGVPAGTVRWRLKTGLERLRAALDDAAPRRHWQLALAPAGALMTTVKTKTKISLLALLLLLFAGGAAWLLVHRDSAQHAAPVAAGSPAPKRAVPSMPGSSAAAAPVAHAEPTRGQKRATIEQLELAGGAVAGRVINWSTGEGVPNAELTFTGELGAVTVRSHDDGAFELAPSAPGGYALTAIAAIGFLPYAPELQHSSVHVVLAKDRAVRGVTVYLFPALDYHGRVVDEAGKPVAGAHVKLLGTPLDEQVLDRPATEWVADKDGAFVFHAADGAVLEAAVGERRGWGVLDGNVQITKQMTIPIAKAAARDLTITGHVVDPDGKPLADVQVRADPDDHKLQSTRATAFATSGPDGAFELRGLDQGPYELSAEVEDHAPVTKTGVAGGSHDVTLALSAGALLAGNVTTSNGDPIGDFTLLVFKRDGAAKRLVTSRSVITASGAFAIRVEPGTYDLVASSSGWAPAQVSATAPAKDVKLELSTGGTLSGQVVSAADHTPVPYARVMREAFGGGASAQPSNAGTVTRADGTFELTGLPPGRLSIVIGADSFHQKIVAGMIATDGEALAPLTIALTPLAPGETPTLELVGIGVALTADGDALVVKMVMPGSGAQAAGIVAGDHVLSVDGISVTELGVDGAVAHIRGTEGTTVAIEIRHGDQVRVLDVERRKLKA